MRAFQSAIAGALRSAGAWLRRSAQRSTEDRRILEQVILPTCAKRADIQRILFVGCASYTQPYQALFEQREYWTIDSVPSRRRFGSRRHIVDRLENLAQHAAPEYFDLVVCNGVLGWGLNAPQDAEAAFAACERHLRPGGELIVGWNDVPPRNRVRPDDVAALRRFEPIVFDPLHTHRVQIDAPHRHIFDFYRKPHAPTSKGS